MKTRNNNNTSNLTYNEHFEFEYDMTKSAKENQENYKKRFKINHDFVYDFSELDKENNENKLTRKKYTKPKSKLKSKAKLSAIKKLPTLDEDSEFSSEDLTLGFSGFGGYSLLSESSNSKDWYDDFFVYSGDERSTDASFSDDSWSLAAEISKILECSVDVLSSNPYLSSIMNGGSSQSISEAYGVSNLDQEMKQTLDSLLYSEDERSTDVSSSDDDLFSSAEISGIVACSSQGFDSPSQESFIIDSSLSDIDVQMKEASASSREGGNPALTFSAMHVLCQVNESPITSFVDEDFGEDAEVAFYMDPFDKYLSGDIYKFTASSLDS